MISHAFNPSTQELGECLWVEDSWSIYSVLEQTELHKELLYCKTKIKTTQKKNYCESYRIWGMYSHTSESQDCAVFLRPGGYITPGLIKCWSGTDGTLRNKGPGKWEAETVLKAGMVIGSQQQASTTLELLQTLEYSLHKHRTVSGVSYIHLQLYSNWDVAYHLHFPLMCPCSHRCPLSLSFFN